MTQSEAESIIGKKVREVLLSKKKKTFVLQIEGAVVSDESIIDDTCLTDTISFHQRMIKYSRIESNGKLADPDTMNISLDQTFTSIFHFGVYFYHADKLLDPTTVPDSLQLESFRNSSPLIVIEKDFNLGTTVKIREKGKPRKLIPLQLIAENFTMFSNNLKISKEKLDELVRGLDIGNSRITSIDYGNLNPWFPVSAKQLYSFTITAKAASIKTISALSETVIEEKRSYINVAEQCDDPIVENLIGLVSELRTNTADILSRKDDIENIDLNMPFIWVIAPPGSGKPQLAYTLDQNGCPLLHIVMRQVNNPQEIYLASNYSHFYTTAVSKDYYEIQLKLPNLIKNSLISVEDRLKSCSILEILWNEKLESIGVLHSLLLLRLKDDYNHSSNNAREFLSLPMSPCEFYAFWKEKRYILPCICLDEFDLSGMDKASFILARNMPRALGIVTLVMGTDSSAGNVINADGLGMTNSDSNPDNPWVYIVHRLPKIILEAIPSFEEYSKTVSGFRNNHDWKNFFDWLEGTGAFEEIPTLRPRFLRLALLSVVKYFQQAVGNASVSDALNFVSNEVYCRTQTGKFRNAQALNNWHIFGQIASFFPRWSICPDFLINKYYADLLPPPQANEADNKRGFFSMYRVFSEADERFKLSYRNNCPDERGFWENQKSILPSSDKEQLGSLIFLTGNPSPAGTFLNSGISLWRAYFECYCKKLSPGSTTMETCSLLLQHQGHILENFANLATILASSSFKAKWNGTNLNIFSALIISMMAPESEPVEFKISDSCELTLLCNALGENCPKMPILGPIGHCYHFVKKIIPEAFIGTLYHAEDKEEIDGIIINFMNESVNQLSLADWIITHECKNIKEPLTASLLRSIMNKSVSLKKTPHSLDRESKRICFIFTNKVNYNKKKLFELNDGECLFTGSKIENSVAFKAQYPPGKSAADMTYENIRLIVIVISLKDIFGSCYTVALSLAERLAMSEMKKSANSKLRLLRATRSKKSMLEPKRLKHVRKGMSKRGILPSKKFLKALENPVAQFSVSFLKPDNSPL